MRHRLWGQSGELDFWTALALGEVGEPEKKAVNLLARVCDPERFYLYCVTGQLPIMGNVTKRIYMALKSGGCLELEDGVPVAWWCFSIGPYASDIPDTDNVVSVRTIVEGEELAMFETGDRHPRGHHFNKQDVQRTDGVRDGFVERFLQDESHRPDKMIGTAALLDVEDLLGDPDELEHGGGQRVFPILGADIPYPHNFQMPPVLPEAQWIRERLNAQWERGEILPDVGADAGDFARAEAAGFIPAHLIERDAADQGVARPLIRRVPNINDGRGVDMHDGTVIIVDEQQAQQVYLHTGVVVAQEVDRLQREGWPPDDIEVAIVREYGVPNQGQPAVDIVV